MLEATQNQPLIAREDLLPVSETNFSYVVGGHHLYASVTPEAMRAKAIYYLSLAVYLEDRAAEKAKRQS